MPIYQTNIWICEICGKCLSTTKEVNPYDDPVVYLSNKEEWDYISDSITEKLVCSSCLHSHKNIPS